MKNASAILLFLFMLSCKNRETINTDKQNENSMYPKIIDSLKLQKLYDETMWFMYCFQCDDTLRPSNPKIAIKHTTFGMLELKFEDVVLSKKEKTVELNFMFYYQGTRCDVNFINNIPTCGAVYKIGTNEMVSYVMYTDFGRYNRDSCTVEGDCGSRFINPVQPEVLRYINTHKAKLNPWFYSEAKRKGLVTDTLPLH